MTEDVAPQLMADITEEFHGLYSNSDKIQNLLKKVKQGNATYAEAQQYSVEVSKLIGQAYQKHVSSAVLPDGKMYYNIASRLLPTSLDENYALVSDYAVQVQQALNEAAGIGLKARSAALNQDRVDGLVDMVSNADQYDEVSSKLLSAIENFSQNVVDETIKENAEFHYQAGLTPKIIRKAAWKCCDWCNALVGSYSYPDVPKDVYRRHENCKCTVLYDPADGSKNFQNVHTKRSLSTEEYDKLVERKNLSQISLTKTLAEHPMRLASYTPESLKSELQSEGYEILPLKRGSLKDIPFEEGGGYKVNFEDGGLLQYHPETRSHHGGAYYKISTGKGGIHRYDLEGNEIDS